MNQELFSKFGFSTDAAMRDLEERLSHFEKSPALMTLYKKLMNLPSAGRSEMWALFKHADYEFEMDRVDETFDGLSKFIHFLYNLDYCCEDDGSLHLVKYEPINCCIHFRHGDETETFKIDRTEWYLVTNHDLYYPADLAFIKGFYNKDYASLEATHDGANVSFVHLNLEKLTKIVDRVAKFFVEHDRRIDEYAKAKGIEAKYLTGQDMCEATKDEKPLDFTDLFDGWTNMKLT